MKCDHSYRVREERQRTRLLHERVGSGPESRELGFDRLPCRKCDDRELGILAT